MPETTPTPVAAKPAAAAKPSFMLRSKLLFRKYQNINGKGMNEVDGENAARSEFGLPPLTEAEIAKLQKRENLVKKVENSKVFTAIASSAFVQKIRAKVEGKPAAAATPVATTPASQPKA
jgi:hypothetical protein